MRTSLLALALSACVFSVESREIDRRVITIDVIDEITLDVLTKAGSLEVYGDPARDTVEMEVVTVRHGQSPWFAINDQAVVDGLVAELSSHAGVIHAAASVDVTHGGYATEVVLRIPADFEVQIDDTSGDVWVSDVGAVSIDDASGSITCEATGPVDIRDRSGDITVLEVLGDVVVDDDSGDIRLDTVSGTATIRDGSGDIIAIDVGALDVISDTSGDVIQR